VHTFTIFGHQACGFCRQAKSVLEAKSLEFKYVDIHEEGISPAALEKTIGHPVSTVPQVFHGDLYVGGYQELMKYLAKEKLL
jgi:glutaredoxin 1